VNTSAKITTIGIVMACAFAVSGCAMDMSQITPEARTAIETQFPEATVKTVRGKLGNEYEITLERGGKTSDVEVQHDGTITEIETAIAVADLPEPVRKTANERSKGKELIKIEKVEVFNPPEQYYEVKWMVLGFKHELEINPDGTVRS